MSATGVLLAAGVGSAAAGVEGVDVSRYQHPSGAPIHWGSALADGQSFAVVKASEGQGVTNDYLASDWSGARKAGMVVSAYHFARPDTSADDARIEARHFVSQVGRTGGFDKAHTLPPVLDLEASGGLSKAQLVTWTKTWLDEVERLTGRTPIIYTGPYFWNDNVGSSAFGRYPLWVAHYTSASRPMVPTGWSSYTFWQYTDRGRVAGISGDVDRNRFAGKPADLAALSNGTPTRLTVASPARVANGEQATAEGRLTTKAGKALAGRTVRVLHRPAGTTTWTRVATVTTGADGTYAQPVTPGAEKTEYTARYAGDVRRLRASAGVSATVVTRVQETRLTVAGDADTVAYGRSTSLRGSLTTAGGEPVAGAEVRVQQRPYGGSWHHLTAATTAADGGYEVAVTPQRRTAYRVRYVGDDAHQRALTEPVVVRVARRVSAALSDARPAAGTTVTLTGRVSPAAAGWPVYRERYDGTTWQRVARTTTSTTGHYRFTVPAKRSGTRTFRVVARYGEALKRGVSATRVLRVR